MPPTMPNAAMETRSRAAPSDLKEDGSSADAPSGFILKLFQMVNGAPKEVISWTPTGDAFIIGSDLKRLETETLPQFFRHNRFQSLVRQLNFYSFRKINRERNVWIYQHKLFHRDHPEDLHLVRRRTCPGLDGRKQRFSRYSARKLTDKDSESDDESSVEAANSSPTSTADGSPTKRVAEIGHSPNHDPKRRRRIWNVDGAESCKSAEDLMVDTSLLSLAEEEKKVEDDVEEKLKNPSIIERSEMAEQSLVVSQVAKKLEQYARKAFGSNGGKGKRQSSGIVTPSFGTASFPTTDLLSYDDEWKGASSPSAGFVTDGDESSSSGDDDSSSQCFLASACDSTKAVLVAPAADAAAAKGILERLLGSGSEDCEAKAAVANFCAANTPSDKNIGGKILELIASCGKLESEFQCYRGALSPFASADPCGLMELAARSVKASETVEKTWEREASRSKAVQEFKVFAVNCIQNILGSNGGATSSALTEQDKSILERSVLVWSMNVA